MGTGDYICVTLRGGAPWGFTLREGEGDTYRPLIVTQVQEDSCAFLAGVRDDDEVVSLNGEPCADLTLLQALELIDTSIDCLQLLLKRYSAIPSDDSESQETSCGERDSSGEVLESTTLHIVSSKHSSQSPKELYISESQDENYNIELDIEFARKPQLLSTKLHTTSCSDQRDQEDDDGETRRCLSPGDMVELQVSLSEQTLDDVGCTSLGSALGIAGELSNREAIFTVPTTIITTASYDLPSSVREPLSQHGVVLSSPSMLGQVEVILQQPAALGAGRGILNVGGSVGSQSEGEEGGGRCEGVPGSLTVSFGVPSEEGTGGEEQDSDSDSEGDQDKPNKHRARHARFRRGESQSEKQLKEAKSKCKRIALLLTAAPPNPNNKGVLMFKKHRQRAKKYTLVSYGTGEDEPDYSDEEDEENEDRKQGTQTVEFTLLAPNNSEADKQFLSNAQSGKSVLTINLDKGLLEIERNLNNQAEMECLPETKGKGALMFAQRRQRMDEISAEHDELRRQGIPVEGVIEAEKKITEHSYIQSTTESNAYMDVNIHQQSQQQQQYQQYQEQQYYEQQQRYQQQQQNYHQQQQQQYQQQQYEQQQYEQQHYQQQQMYQQQQQHQQQEYHQEQQQMQHYSTNINGTVHQQTSEMQSSLSNRTAKPFSAENMGNTTYSPAMSGTNQDSMGQGEQIASRDERISTPAIKTGVLMDSKKRNMGKPMFTFKEAPKVSPNPALLNLLNRSDKKLGFESGPEEDYLSLGAEACNFLQSARLKPKIPPPVAPKPMINPNSPPWSPQIEVTNQDMPPQAENSVSTPAVAPTADTTLAPELEPTPAPAPEPAPPPAPQEAPASAMTEQQPTWIHQPETQQEPLQVPAQEENGHMNTTQQPEHAPVTSWSTAQTQAIQQPPTDAWHPTQVQPQEPPPSQSPPQPPWVTRQPPQTQPQVQPSTNTWTPQIQPSWSQPQEQVQAPAQVQPPWAQPQEPPQPQYQPPWAHPQGHPSQQQQMQPTWSQPQEQMQQQQQAQWAQPSQTESQQQPPWVTQQQQQPQPPWVQQVQPESQSQPPWAQQPQHQAPQQAWPQAQAPGQPQPPWISVQPQQQPPMNTWPPSQTQAEVQPPWVQAPQAQPPAQPQANLNPWAPVPAQPEPQPSWAQQPPEHEQHPMNSWAQDQNTAQQQPPWAQPVPPQPAPQSNWQQSPSKTPPQQPINTWPSAQTQPQTPVSTWAPQAPQTPVSASASILNPRPSPKPWAPPQSSSQNRTPPPPPQRMHSFTIGQRVSSPINPMATVLNPSSQGSSFEMPAVRGKGADMFAKRQSRMEKFVVDSETVQANKASRPTSPVASLPNEWKYTPNVRAPPPRAYNPIQSPSYPPAATKQPPPGSPSSKAKKKGKDKQTPAPKPLNVIDVMKHQPYQLDSSLFLYGPAAEAAKQAASKPECPPPNPPVENQPVQYEQMAPVQQPGPYNAPYPQQAYGMPMQPMMQDGPYQQNPVNVYPPPNPYQQPPGVPYQQAYPQQYQQPAPPPYQPQAPQSPNSPYQQAPYQQVNSSPYQQAPQAPYQPANSPPYLAAPSVPYQPQPPSSFATPSFSAAAARPDSASGGNPVAAPKPKFTAKKSSAQVWKPTAVEKE